MLEWGNEIAIVSIIGRFGADVHQIYAKLCTIRGVELSKHVIRMPHSQRRLRESTSVSRALPDDCRRSRHPVVSIHRIGLHPGDNKFRALGGGCGIHAV